MNCVSVLKKDLQKQHGAQACHQSAWEMGQEDHEFKANLG